MKILRNPEVRIICLIYGIVTVVATMAAFLWNDSYGLFTFVLCIAMWLLYLLGTYKRYKNLNELAEDVNKILHGDDHISLEKYAEGELAILQSEIYKMTIRLREQQQKLLDDKIYLADSIADISHQIRTPLTSINLLLTFLSEENISEEKRRRLVREMYELLSRIDWLITTLLKISKLDAGTVHFKIEEISLKELVERAVSPVAIPMELRGQELLMECEGDFAGDIAWSCEAITNIVKNCMEHTPHGGKLQIRALENAIYREIIISDNGCGISKEDLPHIFERFYKGENSDDKSFGIGLALARMIITSQNGTIKAENNIEGGARFVIRFYK